MSRHFEKKVKSNSHWSVTITSETANLDQSECRKINSHLEIYTNSLYILSFLCLDTVAYGHRVYHNVNSFSIMLNLVTWGRYLGAIPPYPPTNLAPLALEAGPNIFGCLRHLVNPLRDVLCGFFVWLQHFVVSRKSEHLSRCLVIVVFSLCIFMYKGEATLHIFLLS